MGMNEHNAWSRVEAARSPHRPTAKAYLETVFDGFIELHGDRNYADDPAIIGGLAWLDGQPVTVIVQEKGQNTPERVQRNFGSPHPEGYRKALRLMKQAEKFNRPVICLVDTQGAFCGIGAEERGQGQAIAQNLMAMMGLKVPIVSVVIGEGGSGGALALAVADKVAVLENAIYSILSPEGFAAILWKDGTRAKEAAEVMKLTAHDLLQLGVIDDVIAEPETMESADELIGSVKCYLTDTLKSLRIWSVETLLEERYRKFRAIQ